MINERLKTFDRIGSFSFMSKSNFGFLVFFLLLLPLAPLIYQVPAHSQNLIAISAILFLGIPHGAIDNILFLEKSRMKTALFYGWYLGAIAINVGFWLFFPLPSFIFFILLSAYHFGQSQFGQILNTGLSKKITLYISWGLSVILGLVYFNLPELQNTIASIEELHTFKAFFTKAVISNLLGVSIIIFFAVAGYSLYKKKLKVEHLALETLILGLVFLSASLFSFMIAFMLFFVTIHSYKVLQEEFRHFYKIFTLQSFAGFVRKLLPLSILSFVGIGLIFFLIQQGWLTISYPFIMLIIISSITLPHVFVMEKFYSKNQV